MTTANHLLNALAAQDKDSANSAFEAMLQDKLGDSLEVRKVELASTIMDDIVTEGEGMDAQRRWVRQVASIGKEYNNTERGHRVSIHRGELKQAARKYFNAYKPHGVEFMERGTKAVKDARQTLKAQGKIAGLRKEEALDEGGPTRKHFQQTADLIKQIEHPDKRKEMAQHHASLFAKQNPRFDRNKFMQAAGVSEALEPGSMPSNAQLNRNVLTNIRKATQTLRIKNVNPTVASAAHRDFGKLAAKNPKAPGYLLMRKLGAQKAAAVQSLSQAGVPLGQSLEANPIEFNQALQRIKRFK